MFSLAAISMSGMSAARLSLQASAHNIANLGTAGFRRQEAVQTSNVGGQGVSATVRTAPDPGHAMEADLVGQLQAKNAFLANLAVFRASDRMTGSLLDAVG